MSISDTGLVSWTPLEGITSSGLVTLSVEDGYDEVLSGGELNDPESPVNRYTVYQQFIIEVTSVNDAPVIISEAVEQVYLDYEYVYQLSVEDPDDNTFVYSLSGAPNGMSISDSGLITWMPDSVGTYGPIIVSVYDGGEDGASPAVQELLIEVQYLYLSLIHI